MKKCRVCNIEKVESDFEKSKKDKTTNRCKSCKNKKTRDQYKVKMSNPLNREKEKERGREKYYRLGQKYKYNKQAQLDWRSKYPEKLKASIKSRNMERKVKGNHLHHWSYNEEHYTDVIELSITDHNKVHRYMIYDQERKMYRKSIDNTLIDTRISAIIFYKSIGCEITKNNF